MERVQPASVGGEQQVPAAPSNRMVHMDAVQDDVYEVEAVVDARDTGKGMEYFIKWQGYDATQNTWEPAKNVSDALIRQFHGELTPDTMSTYELMRLENIRLNNQKLHELGLLDDEPPAAVEVGTACVQQSSASAPSTLVPPRLSLEFDVTPRPASTRGTPSAILPLARPRQPHGLERPPMPPHATRPTHLWRAPQLGASAAATPITAPTIPTPLPPPTGVHRPAPLATPAAPCKTTAVASINTPMTAATAVRPFLISELTPYLERDNAVIQGRLVELRCKDWANDKGRGRVIRAEVIDGSGDLQISCFNGADALFGRLRQGTAYSWPLAGAKIKPKNEKYNKTSSPFEVELSAAGAKAVREVGDDSALPAHNLSFVKIAGLSTVPTGSPVHVCAVVVTSEAVVTAPNKKGIDVSRRTLTIADTSHRSVLVTIFAPRVQHIEGESGQVIVLKGRTDSYQGTCKLTAFVEDVEFAPSIAEARELQAHWARVRPHVTPLLPALSFTPIASLAAAASTADASTDTVNLLAIVASVEPPETFVGATSGKEQRRISLVVCDSSEGGRSCPLTCFAPAEGALPAFAPGALLAVAGARCETFKGKVQCSVYVSRCTIDPDVPSARALRAWWASQPASIVPPSVASEHPLVAIDILPTLPPQTWVRIVAMVIAAEAVVTAPNKKGIDVSRRTLTIADTSHRSVLVTIFAPRVQHIEGESGQVIVLKGRTDSYQGTCKLTAFVEDVEFAPSIAEARELQAHWARVRPHVTPLLPALSFTPIASLAAAASTADASTDTVNLLAIVASVEPPETFVGATSGKEQRRISLVVCDSSEGGRSCPLTCFAPAEGALPAFAPGALLAVAGARFNCFLGDFQRCTAWIDRCMLHPPMSEASAGLKAWWDARPGKDPPPMITSCARGCLPLVELATACANGTPTVDVIAVVCGDAVDKTFASGEASLVMMLCDYDTSALLYVLRSGARASASYVDGMVLHVAEAELGKAVDGRYTLVATEANVRAYPSTERASQLHHWYTSGAWTPPSDGSASLSIPADDPPRPDDKGTRLEEPASSFIGQFGWEPTVSVSEWRAPERLTAGAGADDESGRGAPPLRARRDDGSDEWLYESSDDEAEPKRPCLRRPLPVHPDDASMLMELRDRNFEACEALHKRRFCHAHRVVWASGQKIDEGIAYAEQLIELAAASQPFELTASSADALLDTMLPRLTNDSLHNFLHTFLEPLPHVGQQRPGSDCRSDCVDFDGGAPEDLRSAAGHVYDEPGCDDYVDREAGCSDDDDDADDDDDEAGSLNEFVVNDEEATSSNYESDDEEAPPITHGRLRRGSDSVERIAAEAQLGRSLEGLNIMLLEASQACNVVDGLKVLELTEGPLNKRGLTLVGETAVGADARSCIIGAVSLGECGPMSRDEFDAEETMHPTHDFAQARVWLDSGSLHATKLHDAVRFANPVPYQQQNGTRKWVCFAPPTAPTTQRRAVLRRLKALVRCVEQCGPSQLELAEEPLKRLEVVMHLDPALERGDDSADEGGDEADQRPGRSAHGGHAEGDEAEGGCGRHMDGERGDGGEGGHEGGWVGGGGGGGAGGGGSGVQWGPDIAGGASESDARSDGMGGTGGMGERDEEGDGMGNETKGGNKSGATEETEVGSAGLEIENTWAPKNTEELLHAIATQDYGVLDDRSSQNTAPALKAYNGAVMAHNGTVSREFETHKQLVENKKLSIEGYNDEVRSTKVKVAAFAIDSYNAKASVYEQVTHKRGQPLPEGFRLVCAPDNLPPSLANTLYLIDVTARMQLAAFGQVAAIVPFVYRKKRKMTLYRGDAALAARRNVASKLTPSMITDLRRARHVDIPNWAPMQQLYDAGFCYDPISGMPVFDSSACAPELLHTVWRLYCDVAKTINTKALSTTGAAFDELWVQLCNHAGDAAAATPAVNRPTQPGAPERMLNKRRILHSENEVTDVDDDVDGNYRWRRRRVCEHTSKTSITPLHADCAKGHDGSQDGSTFELLMRGAGANGGNVLPIVLEPMMAGSDAAYRHGGLPVSVAMANVASPERMMCGAGVFLDFVPAEQCWEQEVVEMLRGVTDLLGGRACIAGSFALHRYLRHEKRSPTWMPGDIDVFYAVPDGSDALKLRRHVVAMAQSCLARLSGSADDASSIALVSTQPGAYPDGNDKTSDDEGDVHIADYIRSSLLSMCTREPPRARGCVRSYRERGAGAMALCHLVAACTLPTCALPCQVPRLLEH